ncbi:hypothetical protein [Roseibium suaedae]|uniref:Uncharacterized protein n=1 Tax=Roseibium suaedae TaxID=735517 RepID=A0A1M7BL71_9HYPH|nr:hypothetical protein [Roseibium suaedae]SHL55782.1 hypothetical protein SAMN05444272_0882 [Roseibium suaedae]
MLKLAALAFSLIAVSLPASAKTISDTVPAGRSTVVGSHAVYGPGCVSGPIPDMKVKKQPEHGRVEFRTKILQLSEKAGKCAGKKIKGTLIIYTPKKGFKGPDKFTVQYAYEKYVGTPRMSFVSDTYKLDVK